MFTIACYIFTFSCNEITNFHLRYLLLLNFIGSAYFCTSKLCCIFKVLIFQIFYQFFEHVLVNNFLSTFSQIKARNKRLSR